MYKLYVSAWLNNGKTTWNKHSEYHNTEKDAILFIYSASLDNFPDLAKTALFRGSRDCQSFHTANKRTRKKTQLRNVIQNTHHWRSAVSADSFRFFIQRKNLLMLSDRTYWLYLFWDYFSYTVTMYSLQQFAKLLSHHPGCVFLFYTPD